MAPDALLICKHVIQETLPQTDDLTLRKHYISFHTFNHQQAWSATEHMPETRHLEAIMAAAKFFLGPAPTPQAPEPASSWPQVAVPEDYQPQLHHAPHGSRPCPVDWLPGPTSGLPHHHKPARQPVKRQVSWTCPWAQGLPSFPCLGGKGQGPGWPHYHAWLPTPSGADNPCCPLTAGIRNEYLDKEQISPFLQYFFWSSVTHRLALFTTKGQGGYISHINQPSWNANCQPRKMLLLEFLSGLV